MTDRREYTGRDVEQVNRAEQELRARGLDESNERVVELVDHYFQTNRGVSVMAEAIVKLVEAQPGFKWLSQAELEYRKIASENPAAAEQIANWFVATQGRPGTLENTGDSYFLNALNLLQELRGRDINSKTIQEAIGRIEAPTSKFDTRKRLPLRYLSVSRPVDPRQHQDDGTGFLGKTPVNEPRWKRISRERSEREANQPDAAAVTSAAVREAKQKAESIAGSTHAETDQLRKLFVTAGTDIDWVQTWASREQMQKQFNKHREVARFIR